MRLFQVAGLTLFSGFSPPHSNSRGFAGDLGHGGHTIIVDMDREGRVLSTYLGRKVTPSHWYIRRSGGEDSHDSHHLARLLINKQFRMFSVLCTDLALVTRRSASAEVFGHLHSSVLRGGQKTPEGVG